LLSAKCSPIGNFVSSWFILTRLKITSSTYLCTTWANSFISSYKSHKHILCKCSQQHCYVVPKTTPALRRVSNPASCSSGRCPPLIVRHLVQSHSKLFSNSRMVEIKIVKIDIVEFKIVNINMVNITVLHNLYSTGIIAYAFALEWEMHGEITTILI
jgi:hypothetical protein